MYMKVALGAIGVGVILMIAYLIVGQVRSQYNALGLNDSNITAAMNSSQSTIFAGFGLLAIGIIVLAAFGLINIFR